MSDRIARVWTGSEWEIITSTAAAPTAVATYQSASPSGPVTGQIWVDSDDSIPYVYTGSAWQSVIAGLALTSGTLAQFAATTSSQLAGVISDETGTGSLVFANSPTLTTPNIGAATGTSLTTTGSITASQTSVGFARLATDGGGNLSIGRTDNVASVPYIDFNSGATTVDYDVRIQASGGTGVTGNGVLTVTGSLITEASSTDHIGLRLPHGTAPTSLTNGDIWTTTSGFFVRINGATKDFGVATKNLLYNGAMQVAQRGTSTAGITSSWQYHTADRWRFSPNSLGTWTMSVENDAPTGSGFRKSLKMLCTTADASPAAGDFLLFDQNLEGQDLQRIAKGTASAQQLTMSFWVKSNKTGTYVVELYDNNNTRAVSASYSIAATDTWERKTITFPADTTGAFNNDNASALTVRQWLAAGSSFTSGTLQTTWATPTDANRAVGLVNLGAAVNNYWQITGYQLETGTVASPFEFKSFAQELQECQRYYQKSYNVDVAPGSNSAPGRIYFYLGPTTSANKGSSLSLKVNMRAAPTVTIYRESNGATGQFNNGEAAIVITEGTQSFTAYSASSASGEVAGHYVASSEL